LSNRPESRTIRHIIGLQIITITITITTTTIIQNVSTATTTTRGSISGARPLPTATIHQRGATPRNDRHLATAG